MAKKLNLKFKTLEQDSLGGTVFTFPRSKLVMTNPMDLPLHGKVKLRDTSKQELLDLWNEVLSENEINIEENTKVEKITPLENGAFKVSTSQGDIRTNHVVIAIGRRGTPRKLNVPGEMSTKVAYRLLEPEELSGKKILIVGGGDSAVESAMLLKDKNEVALSYRKETFARIKPKNAEKITACIENGEIEALFNSEVNEIKEDAILLKFNNGAADRVLDNDLVYIFIGGELPTDFLKHAGIEISKKFGHTVKKY
jgi:thioredoxin reductase